MHGRLFNRFVRRRGLGFETASSLAGIAHACMRSGHRRHLLGDPQAYVTFCPSMLFVACLQVLPLRCVAGRHRLRVAGKHESEKRLVSSGWATLNSSCCSAVRRRHKRNVFSQRMHVASHVLLGCLTEAEACWVLCRLAPVLLTVMHVVRVHLQHFSRLDSLSEASFQLQMLGLQGQSARH